MLVFRVELARQDFLCDLLVQGWLRHELGLRLYASVFLTRSYYILLLKHHEKALVLTKQHPLDHSEVAHELKELHHIQVLLQLVNALVEVMVPFERTFAAQ